MNDFKPILPQVNDDNYNEPPLWSTEYSVESVLQSPIYHIRFKQRSWLVCRAL